MTAHGWEYISFVLLNCKMEISLHNAVCLFACRSGAYQPHAWELDSMAIRCSVWELKRSSGCSCQRFACVTGKCVMQSGRDILSWFKQKGQKLKFYRGSWSSQGWSLWPYLTGCLQFTVRIKGEICIYYLIPIFSEWKSIGLSQSPWGSNQKQVTDGLLKLMINYEAHRWRCVVPMSSIHYIA